MGGPGRGHDVLLRLLTGLSGVTQLSAVYRLWGVSVLPWDAIVSTAGNSGVAVLPTERCGSGIAPRLLLLFLLIQHPGVTQLSLVVWAAPIVPTLMAWAAPIAPIGSVLFVNQLALSEPVAVAGETVWVILVFPWSSCQRGLRIISVH